LVEWRDLENGDTPHADEKIIQRLELLSRLLHPSTPRPPEFRALNCLGYLLEEKPARCAFVLDLSNPPITSSVLYTAPDSLHDVLSDENRNRHRPSQSARFRLAKQLATSVLYLQNAGWLHKGIRSQNVLLLGNGDRSSAFSISQLIEAPYLVGHGYARLSSNYQDTEGVDKDPLNILYRHPDIIGENRARYQKKYDTYSLGVVLIEIALWKPLCKLVSPRRTIVENSRRILDLVTSGDLAHWMGSIYSEAVRICLNCEWAVEDLELEFFEKVVKQLDQCVV
jgi:serine/threonine protein kinase